MLFKLPILLFFKYNISEISWNKSLIELSFANAGLVDLNLNLLFDFKN